MANARRSRKSTSPAHTDALIDDIETDKRVGRASVERPAYAAYAADAFFA